MVFCCIEPWIQSVSEHESEAFPLQSGAPFKQVLLLWDWQGGILTDRKIFLYPVDVVLAEPIFEIVCRLVREVDFLVFVSIITVRNIIQFCSSASVQCPAVLPI